MKLKKILTFVIAGSSFFTVVTNTKQVFSETGPDYSGRCDNAPSAGDKIVITGPDSWKIRSTVMLPIKSENERKVAFAFKRLELEAQKKLAMFYKNQVSDFDNLSQTAKEEAITLEDDTTNLTLNEAVNIASGISSSSGDLLIGSQELGRCWEPGQMVILSRGINSDVQAMIAKPKPINVVDEVVTDNENTTTNTNNGQFRGYDGFGDIDDF